MNKNIIISAAVLTTVAGATLLATTPIFAAETNKPEQSLVQRLATKFGLKQEDVQSVFDEHRQEMRAQMETKINEKLDEKLTQLVKEGKITEAQKQVIINKHKELQAQRETEFKDMKDKTPEERKALMEKNRQELEAWAKQNNIDVKYLGMFRMRGHGPMMKRR